MSTTPMGVQGITEADIADYLVTSPDFFERHAELLGTVQLSSPHGQRAVSLQERQMEMLRDKVKGYERQIVEMIRNGQENVGIAEKLHRWTRSLMLTASAADLPDVLVRELKHQFMIPQAAIRIWSGADAFASLPFTRKVSDDVKTFANSLGSVYCGVNSGFEAVQWLAEPDAAASIALVPLVRDGARDGVRDGTRDGLRDGERDGPSEGASAAGRSFGMLVLASPDPTRYTVDMGTDFLGRIGETASAALIRLLPAA